MGRLVVWDMAAAIVCTLLALPLAVSGPGPHRDASFCPPPSPFHSPSGRGWWALGAWYILASLVRRGCGVWRGVAQGALWNADVLTSSLFGQDADTSAVVVAYCRGLVPGLVPVVSLGGWSCAAAHGRLIAHLCASGSAWVQPCHAIQTDAGVSTQTQV